MSHLPIWFFTEYTATATATTTDDALTRLTSTEGCAPCQERARQHQAERQDFAATTDEVKWHGCIGVEGELTGDGRFIQPEALRWETLPIPLRYVSADNGAHQGAVVVGKIIEIDRQDDGQIMASGTLDVGSP